MLYDSLARDHINESSETAKRRRQERIIGTLSYEADLSAQLSKYANMCMLCNVFGRLDDPHPLHSCPTLRKDIPPYDYKAFFSWQKEIRYNPKIHPPVCFLCHLPQGEKDRLHPAFTGKREDCPYPDLIGPAVYAIMSHPDLKEEAVSEFPGLNVSSPSKTITWLIGAPMKGHISNLISLFLWYARRN